jgi:salicylate hydroxylase
VRGYFDLKHYRTGVILQPGDHVPDQHLSQAVHRADLLGILLGAVRENDADAVHLGHGFESLTQDADGVSVTFTNGNTVTADALVGCDGGGSAVRPFMYGPEPLLYTGKVSFRGLIPSELVTSEIDEDCGSFYGGPDRSWRTHGSPVGRRRAGRSPPRSTSSSSSTTTSPRRCTT